MKNVHSIVTEEWRFPHVGDDETCLFSEGGRIRDREDGSPGVTYQSFSFRVVKDKYGGVYLRVKHGAGEEQWQVDSCERAVVEALSTLGSDGRYFILFAIMRAHQKSRQAAMDSTALEYRRAFAEGRLKKRKLRGQDLVKVWIERKEAA